MYLSLAVKNLVRKKCGKETNEYGEKTRTVNNKQQIESRRK
jgi:hypothetical protein